MSGKIARRQLRYVHLPPPCRCALLRLHSANLPRWHLFDPPPLPLGVPHYDYALEQVKKFSPNLNDQVNMGTSHR
jgi:hypothetical protein